MEARRATRVVDSDAEVALVGVKRVTDIRSARLLIVALLPFCTVERLHWRALMIPGSGDQSAEGARAHVGEQYLHIMDSLKAELAECMAAGCGLRVVSVTGDMYKNNITKDYYFGIVVVFTRPKTFDVVSRFVALAPFESTIDCWERRSDQVLRVTEDVLDFLDVGRAGANGSASDAGSGERRAFEKLLRPEGGWWIRCIPHGAHLAMQDAMGTQLDKASSTHVGARGVFTVIKRIIGYMNSSDKARLHFNKAVCEATGGRIKKKKTPSDAQQRWSAKFKMMGHVLKFWDEVPSLHAD